MRSVLQESKSDGDGKPIELPMTAMAANRSMTEQTDSGASPMQGRWFLGYKEGSG